MEETKKNKMADAPMKKLFWKMGLPMIISMVLQALYNVVDSIFVANMGESGAIANQALTVAFPIQIYCRWKKCSISRRGSRRGMYYICSDN